MLTDALCLELVGIVDVGLDVLQNVQSHFGGVFVQLLRQEQGYVAGDDDDDGVDELCDDFRAVQMLVRIFTEDGFYHGLDQQFVSHVPQDAARLVVGVLQDELQSPDIVRAKDRRMQVDVIELDIDELRSGADVERMDVARCNHEQVPLMVGKLVVVYPLDARTGQRLLT